MPKVSVIIPFQNRIPWLNEAVDSVLAQTFQDFEIIIVDDGSTDAYQPPDDLRIRYIRQERIGPARARNIGIDEARGEYISFLDSDDLFMPTKLERQVALMDSRPETLLTHTSYTRMTASGEILETIHSGKLSGGLSDELVFTCPVATPTVVMRKHAGLRFDETVKPWSDNILWLEVAARSALIGIDEALVKVRMHGSNAILDHQLQVGASMAIWNHAARKLPLSRRLRSRVHLTVYQYGNDPRDLLRALVAWPGDSRIYRKAARHLLQSVRYRFSSAKQGST